MMQPRILLVEQDAMLAEMYAMQLLGIAEVVYAHDAQSALDLLDDKSSFDVLITDTMLGSNNGIEVIHEIKSYDDWIDIPIIVLSSVPLEYVPNRQWARYGVSQALYKPTISRELLRESVSKTLQETLLLR